MSLLNILHYPDSRLRTRAVAIESVDDEVRKLAEDMLETMYDAPGIGLAATQVNVHRRLLVCDVSENHNQPLCLINPEIIDSDGSEEMEEGCLSVPGIYETVIRPEQVTVSYLDLQGEQQQLQADGLLAVCIQHEMDHLEGKLFVDYLSRLKQQRIRKKLEKQQRQNL